MWLKNCWYVIAWDHEIPAEGFLARTVIGEPLLVFRASAGKYVALEDRCCHRHAPLSLGRREGDCIAETEDDVKRTGLPTILLGHVGDGNFHLGINFNPDSPDEVERAYGLNRRVAQRAIGMGGTCTGEHGIGLGKIEFMEAEHGAGTIAAMRAVKAALDPHNLLNPGKVLP